MNETVITARPGTPFIDIVREFEATPVQVFRAWTDPELLPRWLGPSGTTTTVLEYDAVTGGRYSYVHRDGSGRHGFRGVFHTVEAGERIVQTFQYDGWPDQVSLETLTFEDLGGRTRVHTHAVFGSVESRDAMIESGMEHGVRDSMTRLDTLLTR
ncbi:SRPBCC family protein [Nonomuraea sp. SMC257]|uniref:SRPBCC family protein n=1 Tax=Nonomuraea montanisoli TaxID=2741721 RepID=A0A7Y6I7V3_9ACTN|nr:SRPBCC family protein [Nonomuraea montanisoli]NUW33327.1 SRPBCC family protein [Nonomuraea montanisoli]